jgi:hypothetical protein
VVCVSSHAPRSKHQLHPAPPRGPAEREGARGAGEGQQRRFLAGKLFRAGGPAFSPALHSDGVDALAFEGVGAAPITRPRSGLCYGLFNPLACRVLRQHTPTQSDSSGGRRSAGGGQEALGGGEGGGASSKELKARAQHRPHPSGKGRRANGECTAAGVLGTRAPSKQACLALRKGCAAGPSGGQLGQEEA